MEEDAEQDNGAVQEKIEEEKGLAKAVIDGVTFEMQWKYQFRLWKINAYADLCIQGFIK